MQGWNGWAKDHLQNYNAQFIDSLLPKRLIDLEDKRIGHKVNKENNEIFRLFNDIKGHNVREPEQRFIGEVSRLVASKWGLNGNLGYKVPYPHIPPDKHPYRKIVVNLNERGHAGLSSSQHTRRYETGERRMALPNRFPLISKQAVHRLNQFSPSFSSAIRNGMFTTVGRKNKLFQTKSLKRTTLSPTMSGDKLQQQSYWSAVITPSLFPSKTMYKTFVNDVKNDFNMIKNLKNHTLLTSANNHIATQTHQPIPSMDSIATGERKNLIFRKCGMNGIFGEKGNFDVSIDDFKFKAGCTNQNVNTS